MNQGTIQHAGGRVTFRYERRLRHPVGVVWQAITDAEAVERWTGMRPELDLRPGGQYVTHHGNGDRVVDRVVRVEPPRLFEHTFWVHVNPTALVTWELHPIGPAGDECLLVLTHSLAVDDVRQAAAKLGLGDDHTTILARNGAGWHRLLDRLESRLDARTTEWSPEAQRELQDRYAALIAP
jgi:uncharacterized protein YndB with AHSA1/START domain